MYQNFVKKTNTDLFLNIFLECNTNEGTWIEQEIIRLEDILDKTEFHLQRSSLTAVQRKRYIKRRTNTRKFLEKAQV